MKITPLAIPEVMVFEPQVFGDHRGFFLETYRDDWFKEVGVDVHFVQDNHSKSGENILRGLHYQIKQTQGKLVRVTDGEVYDVAVDVRKNSPTFGQWVGQYLSAENKKIMWIPPGFAHGFYVTSESAEFLYKCTDLYAPEHERYLLWNDSAIGIEWPLNGREPILSEKDKNALPLAKVEVFE